jgi:hypothetical protein
MRDEARGEADRRADLRIGHDQRQVLLARGVPRAVIVRMCPMNCDVADLQDAAGADAMQPDHAVHVAIAQHQDAVDHGVLRAKRIVFAGGYRPVGQPDVAMHQG